MGAKQLPHQRERQPCARCKSKDRVRVCSTCYSAMRNELAPLAGEVQRSHDAVLALTGQVERYEKALSEYGVHKHHCQVVVSGTCSCGLSAAFGKDPDAE